MGRVKMDPKHVLQFPVKTRVNAHTFQHIQKLLKESRHRSISEVVRQIISGKPIKVYTVNAEYSMLLEEIARIRMEIHSIGVNINQVVKSYHSNQKGSSRHLNIFMLQDRLQDLEYVVEKFNPIIEEISERWLRESE